MKQIKKNNNKRLALILVVGFLILCLSGAAVYGYFNSKKSDNQQPAPTTSSSDKGVNQVNTSPPSNEESQNGYENKKDFTNNGDNVATGTATVTINSIEQNSDSLSVNVIVYDNNDTGMCTFNVNGYSQTVRLEQLPSYSLCKGFIVPLSKVPKGRQEIVITYSSNKASGKASKSIVVE